MAIRFYQNNWASGMRPFHEDPEESRFDEKVRELGLQEWEFPHSLSLRIWVDKHKNFRYVPEWLLNEWGIKVDVYDSAN